MRACAQTVMATISKPGRKHKDMKLAIIEELKKGRSQRYV